MVFNNAISSLQYDIKGHFHKAPDTKLYETAIEQMTDENKETLIRHFDDYMIFNSCFINSDLTIIDLAEGLNIHSKRISSAINSI